MTLRTTGLLAAVLLSTLIYAQPTKPKTVAAPKKATLQLKDLKLTIQVDTSQGNTDALTDGLMIIRYLHQQIPVEFMIHDAGKPLDKLKRDYRDGEKLDPDQKPWKLSKFTDSTSLTVKGVEYWRITQHLRDIPTHWYDMENKVKLSSDKLVTFLNSDKESWNNSRTRLIYYAVHPKTKKVFSIFTSFKNGGEVPAGFEEKVKEIMGSIKFL